MPQESWNKMTEQDKVALLLGKGVFAFPHDDPDVAINYCGCSGTLNLSQYIDIVNGTTISLYFKVDAVVITGESAKWTDKAEQLGIVGAAQKARVQWTPNREVPTSKTTDTLRVWLKAYTDPGYSNLYGEDYTDFNYHFFSHSDGTIIHFSDFENTMDGWTGIGEGGFGNVTPAYPYTGAYSLRLVCTGGADGNHNSTVDSGGTIPTQSYYIKKTFNTSGYSTAYLVLHFTCALYDSSPLVDSTILRIWTATTDHIIKVPAPYTTYAPYRIAIPLVISTGEEVKITALFCTKSGAGSYMRIDSIIVVGFS